MIVEFNYKSHNFGGRVKEVSWKRGRVILEISKDLRKDWESLTESTGEMVSVPLKRIVECNTEPIHNISKHEFLKQLHEKFGEEQ